MSYYLSLKRKFVRTPARTLQELADLLLVIKTKEFDSLEDAVIEEFEEAEYPLTRCSREPSIINLNGDEVTLPSGSAIRIEEFINDNSSIQTLLPIEHGFTQIQIKQEVIRFLEKVIKADTQIDQELSYLEAVGYSLSLRERHLEFSVIDDINLQSDELEEQCKSVIEKLNDSITQDQQYLAILGNSLWRSYKHNLLKSYGCNKPDPGGTHSSNHHRSANDHF
jgi:hypothetical protein